MGKTVSIEIEVENIHKTPDKRVIFNRFFHSFIWQVWSRKRETL